MNREFDSFLNFDNGTFLWTGVVEDRFDPLKIGRIRVRIFGIHSANREEIPTDCLPWASVVLPVTEAGSSGIGNAVPSLVDGTWVIGFFRDGHSCQDPVILGSLPGVAPPDWRGSSLVPTSSESPPPSSSDGIVTNNGPQFLSLEDTGNVVKFDLMSAFGDPFSSTVNDIKSQMLVENAVDPNATISQVFPGFTSFLQENPSISPEMIAASPETTLPPDVVAEVTGFTNNAKKGALKITTSAVSEEVRNTLNVSLSSGADERLKKATEEYFNNSSKLPSRLIELAKTNPSRVTINNVIDEYYDIISTSSIQPFVTDFSQTIIDPVSTIVGSYVPSIPGLNFETIDLKGISESILSDITTSISGEITSLENSTNTILQEIIGVKDQLTSLGDLDFSDFTSISGTLQEIGFGIDALTGVESHLSGTLEAINGNVSSLMGMLSNPQGLISSAFDVAVSSVQEQMNGIVSSVIGESMEMFTSAFGSVTAPLQEIETMYDSALSITSGLVDGIDNFSLDDVLGDGMSKFKLESLLNGNEIFNVFEETGAALFESIKTPIETSFQDIGRGISASLDSGILRKKPISRFPIFPSESDVSRVARGHESVYKPGGMKYNYDKNKDSNWTEPDMFFESVYPFNSYKETESGHIVEFDDTPDHERLQIRHKSGTGLHINPDGTQKQEIIGDSYSVYVKDNKVHVYGTLDLFVDLDSNVSIVGEANIKIGSDANISVGGNCFIDCENKVDVRSKGDINLSAGRNLNLKASNAIHMTSTALFGGGVKFKNEEDQDRTNEENKKGIMLHAEDEMVDIYSSEGIGMTSMKTISSVSELETSIISTTKEIDVKGSIINLNSGENDTEIDERDAPPPIRALNIKEPHDLVSHPRMKVEDSIEGIYDGSSSGISNGEYTTALKGGIVDGSLSAVDYSNRAGGIELPSSEPANIEQRTFSASNNAIITAADINNKKEGPYSSTKNPVYDLKLSDHLYLRDLTWGTAVSKGNTISSNAGNSEEDIILNLANLAKALDPVFEVIGKPAFSSYGRTPGKVTINSGFRKNSSSGSAHAHGCAVDIQIQGLKANKYFDLAVQIEGLLSSYDLILLEYAKRTHNPWIHIGIWRTKARGLQMTYNNDRKYADSFINLANKYYR